MPDQVGADIDDSTVKDYLGEHSALIRALLEALKFTRENRRHLVFYTPHGTPGGDEGIVPASRMLDKYISIEVNRLRDLGALVADRIDQDSTSLSFDIVSGDVLGAMSDAARAAKYAMNRRIIEKGGEDLGWGR